METNIQPRGYWTRLYIGEGVEVALCTYHLRKRQELGQEYEAKFTDINEDVCKDACVECVERQQTQGDSYSLTFVQHFDNLSVNSGVIHSALEDMISELEIVKSKLAEGEHAEKIDVEQRILRGLLNRFDTVLNDKYSLVGTLSAMLDDDGNEIIDESEDDDDERIL